MFLEMSLVAKNAATNISDRYHSFVVVGGAGGVFVGGAQGVAPSSFDLTLVAVTQTSCRAQSAEQASKGYRQRSRPSVRPATPDVLRLSLSLTPRCFANSLRVLASVTLIP